MDPSESNPSEFPTRILRKNVAENASRETRVVSGDGPILTSEKPEERSAITPDPVEAADNVSLPPILLLDGRFLLQDQIGRGGSGVVHLATDLLLQRSIAVKILRTELVSQPEAIDRFNREARMTAGLNHPNIPAVYQVGRTADGRPYMAMKLIAGQTFGSQLRLMQCDFSQALLVLEQVSEAVGYAHSKGVIHRDLKPENVMLGSFGEVQVMDWGLAKFIDDHDEQIIAVPEKETLTQEVTQVGEICGTPAYIAPEQALGDILTLRTDVFGLGAILCEIITGKPPFDAADTTSSLQQAIEADLTLAIERLRNANADQAIVELCCQCLQIDPLLRPANGHEVAMRIKAYRRHIEERVQQTAIGQAKTVAVAEEERKRRRVQGALWLSCFALFLVAGLTIWLNQRQNQQRREQQLRDDQAKILRHQSLSQALNMHITQTKQFRLMGIGRRGIEAIHSLNEEAMQLGEHQIASRAANAEQQFRLLEQFDQMRIKKRVTSADDAVVKTDSPTQGYQQAFANAGFDFQNGSVKPLCEQITNTYISSELISVLDAWGIDEQSPVVREKIWTITYLLTGQAWRLELAKPLDLVQLRSLVDRIPPPERTVAILNAIGNAISEYNPHEGASFLAAACRRYPSDFWLLMSLGTTLYQIESPDETESAGCYRAALALRPDADFVWERLGLTLVEKGDHLEAEKCLKRAITLNPNNANAYSFLSKLYRSMYRHEDAITVAKAAIKIEPNHSRSWYRLSIVYRDQHQYDLAMMAAKRAIECEPTTSRPYHQLAKVYLSMEDFSQARDAFCIALALEPENSETLTQFASLERELGNDDASIQLYRTMYQLDSNAKSLASIDLIKRFKVAKPEMAKAAASRKMPEKLRDLVDAALLAGSHSCKHYGYATELFVQLEKIEQQLMTNYYLRAAENALRFAHGDDATEKPTVAQQRSARSHALRWIHLELANYEKRALSTDVRVKRFARDRLVEVQHLNMLRCFVNPIYLATLSDGERAQWLQMLANLDDLIRRSAVKEAAIPNL